MKNLSGAYSNVKDVSFSLREGEILGIAGLAGAGRSELLETIFGIAKKKSGTVTVHGRRADNRSSRQAIQNGFALLTEERRATGIFGILDIIANTTISNLKNYRSGGIFLNSSKMKSDTMWAVRSMKIKTSSLKTKIRTLSGGNQQKVILGRWLLTKPEILLPDARHRCGCEIRNISADNRSCRERKKRYYGIFRNAGAARSMRPHTRNVRRTCRGRASGTDNAGRNNGVIRQIRLTLRNASSN